MTLDELHAAIASARWFTRLGTFTPRAGYAASRDLNAWAEASVRELFIFSEPHPITESGLDWLPTSHGQPDPVHGDALRTEAEERGCLDDFQRTRMDAARATYGSLRPADVPPQLKVGPVDFSNAAKGAAVYAMRMAASEIVTAREGFWVALVPIYADGFWPYGRLPSGAVAVL